MCDRRLQASHGTSCLCVRARACNSSRIEPLAQIRHTSSIILAHIHVLMCAVVSLCRSALPTPCKHWGDHVPVVHGSLWSCGPTHSLHGTAMLYQQQHEPVAATITPCFHNAGMQVAWVWNCAGGSCTPRSTRQQHMQNGQLASGPWPLGCDCSAIAVRVHVLLALLLFCCMYSRGGKNTPVLEQSLGIGRAQHTRKKSAATPA